MPNQQLLDYIQPQKRKWKKTVLIILAIAIFLIIGVIFLPNFLSIFSKDIASIDDSDLKLQKVLILDKDNAYFDLIKIKDVIYEPEDKSQIILDMVAGKAFDIKLTVELEVKNEKAFEYFNQAVKKPKYQNPEIADPKKITPFTDLPYVGFWRKMARLSAIRSFYLSKLGKDKEAIDEALNSVKIGQKIQESQVSFIEYLVAASMREIGLETLQKIIPSIQLTSKELKQYIQELDKFYKNEDGLIKVFKGEFYFQSLVIDSIVSKSVDALKLITGKEYSQKLSERMGNSYYFKLNKTKLLFAEYARENIKNINAACGEIKDIKMEELTPTNFPQFYIEENVVGKMLYDFLAVGLTNTIIRKCEEDLLIAATQAILAIKAFVNDNGNLPLSLNELIPDYLSKTPNDPFSDQPLKYSTFKKIIYSIGKDLQDSGGSEGDDWRKMPDPTFKMNFSAIPTPSSTILLLTDALNQGDVEKALDYFDVKAKVLYRDILIKIKEMGNLSGLAQELTKAKLISINNNLAKYVIERLENNETISYFIYFVLEGGKWKLHSL